MRVAVLHAFMDVLGGGEYLMLMMSKAFKKYGYTVDLYTVTEPDWDEVERIFGIDSPKNIFHEVHVHGELNPFRSGRGRFVRLKRLVAYHGFFNMFNRERLREKYDLVVDTQSNTASPVDIAYIHYPVIAETYTRHTPVYDVYSALVRLLYNMWFGRPMSRYVLTNSRWTAGAIIKYYGVSARVVYPPVDVDGFRCRGGAREDVIVTLSRITPEKNLEAVAKLSDRVRRYRFVMIGRLDDEATYRRLLGHRLEVHVGASRSQVRRIMCGAKYYLHPPFREHFGISVVEAMASGLVPIVYRDSGSCIDIVRRVDHRLCYDDIGDVPRIIGWVEENRLWDRLSARAVEVAYMFDKRMFYERLYRVLRDLRVINW